MNPVTLYTATGADARTLRWNEPAPLGLIERASIGNARMWMAPSGKTNFFTLLASIDDGAVHVSISHNKRYPTWDEILAVRAWAFHPDTEVVMVLARRGEYVNIHPNCFHLWESACGKEGR